MRTRNITRDNDRHYYIMIKWSIHQEDITILNIYDPNNGTFEIPEAKIDKIKKKLMNPQLQLVTSILISR